MKSQLMAIHGKILYEAIKWGSRYALAERKVFGKIYGRYPGQSAAAGARHGLFAGGTIGSIITGSDNLEQGGETKNEYGTKTGPSDQARGGYKRNSSRWNSTANKSYKQRRCSCPRKYGRSRNRF